MFGKKELENKIKELEEENQNLKKENQKISESYGKSVSKKYLDRIDTLNNRIEELNNDKQELKKEIDDLKISKQQISSNYSDTNRQYEALKYDFNSAKELNQKYRDDICELEQSNGKLQEEIEILTKRLKEKDVEIEAYKNAIQNISFNFNGTIKSTSKKVSKSKGE